MKFFKKHHEVLKEWEKYNIKNVFSLDYHSDTHKTLLRYLYNQEVEYNENIKDEEIFKNIEEKRKLIIKWYLSGFIKLEEILKDLKNDEFLDFAIRGMVVEKIFVHGPTILSENNNEIVSVIDNPNSFKDNEILLYSPQNNTNELIEDYILEKSINLITNKIDNNFFEDFILDIDLDVFNTIKSINPKQSEIFRWLIKKAKLITIAEELEYVDELKEDEIINVDYLIEKLEKLIK